MVVAIPLAIMVIIEYQTAIKPDKLGSQQMSNSAQKTQPTQAMLDQVINLYNQGKLKKTVSVAENLVKKYPNAQILYDILGVAYMGLKNADKTIANYQKALLLNPYHTDAYNNMGMALYDQGKFDDAIKHYQKAVRLEPDFADAHFNLGNALQQTGDLKQAIKSYKASLAINPEDAEVLLNYGNAQKKYGNFYQAIEIYSKILKIDPNYSKAQTNKDNVFEEKSVIDKLVTDYARIGKLEIKSAEIICFKGTLLKARGYVDAAIDSYKQAIKINPDFAEVYNNMGNALNAKGETDTAIENYKKAIKINPDFAEAYRNMGLTLKDKGETDAAIDSYKKAIKINPNYAEAYSDMGLSLKDNSELDAAIDSYKQAIKINPDFAEAYTNMGLILHDKGELSAALDSYKQAIKINPNFAYAYNNMGLALNDNGELDAAIDNYKQAIKIKPDYADAHLNLSFAFLNSGRLNEGLDEYEWRWKTAKRLSAKRHFSKPLWDGKKSLKGKRILLWCEQGVGDTVNWSSRLSLVASQARHCILECQEKLVPLLARSFPSVEVKPENRRLDSVRDDFDFHLPMGSLYKHFIPKISKNAKTAAFLVPDPIRISFWRERLNFLGEGPYVGISWKSSDMSSPRLPNYAPISEWHPLLALPDVIFINLQYRDSEDDLRSIKNEFGVTVHNFVDLDQYDDVDDVAALSAALDVVVSIQSTVPLISAGVGTSTKHAYWRQSSWNNILHEPVGPLVDKLGRNTWEPWGNVFRLITEDIVKLTDN